MLISKTPYRISFFGGGSDYPEWYNKYSGAVLSTSINKYIYITCRSLPNFFDHKYRIVWSKIEQVKKIKNISHPVVKSLLKHLKTTNGLEIHYDGDLPAGCGMGSSSAFTVGLINALYCMQEKKITNLEIAKKAIFFEQKIMKEIVGSQDQIATAIGGFNKIIFNRSNNFKIIPKTNNKNIKKLEDNLILIFTGKKRNAQDIAKKYVSKLSTKNKNFVNLMLGHVEEGEKILNGGNIDEFGKLLNSAWITKKKLSSHISDHEIDNLYDYAIKNGAIGGKLLGAGGGGFFLFYVKKEKKNFFLKNNKKIIKVPFNFTNNGTEILYKD